MTDRLAEIKARLQAATPGPWKAWTSECGTRFLGDDSERKYPSRLGDITYSRDLDFIANSRADIEWAVAEIERLRKQREKMYFVAECLEDVIYEYHHGGDVLSSIEAGEAALAELVES